MLFNVGITLFALIIVGLDQYVKNWAIANLQNGSVVLVEGFLKLTYVENYGAAFGIFKNQKILLVVLTSALIIYCMYLVYSKKIGGAVMAVGAMCAVAGGAGNLIDRVMRGFVVDFFDVGDWLNFAVFNIADCFVVGGVAIMAFYIIFLDKSPKEEAPKTKGEN